MLGKQFALALFAPQRLAAPAAFRLQSTKAAKKPADDRIGRELYLENRVVRLILNSPKNRNALSLDFMAALHKELQEIDTIERLRAVIIAHEGPAFSAGHNLKELTTEGKSGHKAVFRKCTELLTFIRSMQLPVVAEISGVAAAAGCQLVASCDIIVAGSEATFSVPGGKVGLFCSTPGIPLARNVPLKVAMDLLLTSRTMGAEEALRAGFVSRIVSTDKVRFEALKVAESICDDSSRSVTALGKAFFYAQSELRLAEAYRHGEQIMTTNLSYVDTQEGIDSFFGKRKPTWTNTDERAFSN